MCSHCCHRHLRLQCFFSTCFLSVPLLSPYIEMSSFPSGQHHNGGSERTNKIWMRNIYSKPVGKMQPTKNLLSDFQCGGIFLSSACELTWIFISVHCFFLSPLKPSKHLSRFVFFCPFITMEWVGLLIPLLANSQIEELFEWYRSFLWSFPDSKDVVVLLLRTNTGQRCSSHVKDGQNGRLQVEVLIMAFVY